MPQLNSPTLQLNSPKCQLNLPTLNRNILMPQANSTKRERDCNATSNFSQQVHPKMFKSWDTNPAVHCNWFSKLARNDSQD